MVCLLLSSAMIKETSSHWYGLFFFLLGLVVVVDESPEELALVVLVERNLVRQILGKALD